MREMPLNSDFAGPRVPGSAIDFATVGELHYVDERQADADLAPYEVERAVSLHGRERLVRVRYDRPQLGDIIVIERPGDDALSYGRPMQVKLVLDDTAYAIDDPSLGEDPDSPSLGAAFTGRPYRVWALLDSWGVYRCPRCRAPGLRILRGMPAVFDDPRYLVAGCSIMEGDADISCSECDAKWDVPTAPDLDDDYFPATDDEDEDEE